MNHSRYFRLDNSHWRKDNQGRPVGDPWSVWVLSLPCWLCDVVQEAGGREVDDWDPTVFAFYWAKRPRVDLPAVAGDFHIMSPALQAALNELAPGCIQFLPIRIRSPIGDDITKGYAVANYRHWLEAVDRKRSRLLPHATFRKQHGGYLLEHVVLNPKRITQPVFRVIGVRDLHVYRDDIVAALTERKLSGLYFEEVDS